MRRVVFLDRDGTLIVQKAYLDDPREVELIEGAADALRRLREAGFAVILVTNQSGVARGYFGMDKVNAIHDRIRGLLKEQDASVDRVFICPHAPDAGCSCRKPGIGMIDQAARELPIDLGASFIIGDKACDIDCGRNAGVKPILVRTGYGASCEAELGSRAAHVAVDLAGAVDWILETA